MTKFSKFSLLTGLFWAIVLFACQKPAPGPVPEIQIGRNYDLDIKWKVPEQGAQTKVYLEKRKNGGILSLDTLLLDAPNLSVDNFGRLDGVSIKMLSVGKDGKESMPTAFFLSPPRDSGIIIGADIIAGRTSVGNLSSCDPSATYTTVNPVASEVDGLGIKTTRYDLDTTLGIVYKVSVNTGTSTIVYVLSPENNSSMAYSTNYTCLTGSGFSIIESDTTLLYSSGSISFRTRPSCARLPTDPTCLFRLLRIIYPQSWTVTVEKCNNCN